MFRTAKNRKKIVAIDDHLITLELLYDIFDEEGYDVYTYSSLPSIAFLKQLDPDIFIIDIVIRNFDGRIFCQELRKELFFKNKPILILSAYVDNGESVLASGANMFIQKPFDLDQLIEVVHSFSCNEVTR